MDWIQQFGKWKVQVDRWKYCGIHSLGQRRTRSQSCKLQIFIYWKCRKPCIGLMFSASPLQMIYISKEYIALSVACVLLGKISLFNWSGNVIFHLNGMWIIPEYEKRGENRAFLFQTGMYRSWKRFRYWLWNVGGNGL